MCPSETNDLVVSGMAKVGSISQIPPPTSELYGFLFTIHVDDMKTIITVVFSISIEGLCWQIVIKYYTPPKRLYS